MNRKLLSWISLFAVLATFLTPIQAYEWESGCDNNSWSTDECCDIGPLNACGWSIGLRTGIAPTHWTSRPSAWATLAEGVAVNLGDLPKFRDQHDLPWIIGGEIAYNVSDSSQLYIEANYLDGGGKSYSFTESLGTVTYNFHERFGDYRAWSAYLGTRYYFSRSWLCDSIAPFIGFKAGFIEHRNTGWRFTATPVETTAAVTETVEITTRSSCRSKVGVSAGASLGFDIEIWDSISAVLAFEFVASQAPTNRHHVSANSDNPTPISHLHFGSLGTEISFPITLGLRYNF